MKKIILTGSKGLIGSELLKFLNIKYKILELDLKIGHDLTNEKFVKKWFEYTDNHKIKLLGNNEGNKYHNDMGTRVAILERRH